MSETYYQIYKRKCFTLIKSMVIKHSMIADAMNTALMYRSYDVNYNDKRTWRYYLNLNGQYHVADQDALYARYGTNYLMVTVSTENGAADVPLTKDLIHGEFSDKSLANEYQLGGRIYKELLARYPEFELLINGILNPIDLSVSTSAQDGEILHIAGRYKIIEDDTRRFSRDEQSVNLTLIETQEDGLILELQEHIYQYQKHWHNPEYINGNDLYAPTWLGMLSLTLVQKLLNIRLGNCKTPKAHSFHIREYLESFGKLGRYIDFIPLRSALWLYRNLNYLEANRGKQHIFDNILDNLLTPNEIPLSAYSIRHELTGMSHENPLPNGLLYKEVLNFEVLGASDDDRTVRDILEDQIPLARENGVNLSVTEKRIQEAINWGGDDRINSKVLESEMLELGEPYPFTLEQFLFNLWGYTAHHDLYHGSVFVTDPVTGDRLSFTGKDAYILATYCLNKSVANNTLTTIPDAYFYHIPRHNIESLLPSDKSFKPKPDMDTLMSWCVTPNTRRLKVLEILGSHAPNFQSHSANEFFDNVNEMYLERVNRYNIYSATPDIMEKGDLTLIAKRLYWMGFKETISTLSYSEWFSQSGFDVTRYTSDDLLKIGLELVASATGVTDDDIRKRRWLQESVLAILKHFMSYSVHVIEKYADGVVAYLDGQALRYSNFTWQYTSASHFYVTMGLICVPNISIADSVYIKIATFFERITPNITNEQFINYDPSVVFEQSEYVLPVNAYGLNTRVWVKDIINEIAEPIYIEVIDSHLNLIYPSMGMGDVNSSALSALFDDSMYSSIAVSPVITGRDSAAAETVFDELRDIPITANTSYDEPKQSRDNSKDRLYQLETSGVLNFMDAAIDPIVFSDKLVASYVNTAGDTKSKVLGGDAGDMALDRLLPSKLNSSDASIYLDVVDESTLLVAKSHVRSTDPFIGTTDADSDKQVALEYGAYADSHDTSVTIHLVDNAIGVSPIEMIVIVNEIGSLNTRLPESIAVLNLPASLSGTEPAVALNYADKSYPIHLTPTFNYLDDSVNLFKSDKLSEVSGSPKLSYDGRVRTSRGDMSYASDSFAQLSTSDENIATTTAPDTSHLSAINPTIDAVDVAIELHIFDKLQAISTTTTLSASDGSIATSLTQADWVHPVTETLSTDTRYHYNENQFDKTGLRYGATILTSVDENYDISFGDTSLVLETLAKNSISITESAANGVSQYDVLSTSASRESISLRDSVVDFDITAERSGIVFTNPTLDNDAATTKAHSEASSATSVGAMLSARDSALDPISVIDKLTQSFVNQTLDYQDYE